ncbi:hypothetical protein TRP66_03060 [Pseudomonas sp. JDS28PS106]|uniref:hypothetical protein n=1 Tax=Pseudomonas sp. JDS28PS106 TaxID=2497235 RepID=UPI002FD3A133
MNAALRIAQFEYDNRLPVDLCDAAELQWIENGVYTLVELRTDVSFKRRLHPKQGVTFEQFAVAVDEYLMEQLGGSGVSASALGRLVLAAKFGSPAEAASTADEALNSPDPSEALRQIAVRLLKPLARDGLIAQAEDDEL